ncbi:hypothetical protein CMO83_05235 [Candidatus Woesearchaeota archaeon]|jgi:hypothetical protein|nr:hypothetical protein [Candidatus Woesearchaeota archaeon]|tara:strand:+ start:4741 stop:5058 length:318 start_codon:yes stop_codon:yes gene_type:complete
MAGNELKLNFKSYKTLFGKDAGEVTIKSNGQMHDGGVEIVPCRECGGPIMRFQQKSLEGMVNGKEIFSHSDKKCCSQWTQYLNSNPQIKQQYAELSKVYQSVVSR